MKSMTAFARVSEQGPWGSLVCELRSVNHRYLDLTLRVPEALYDLEMLLRERIRRDIHRGKVECILRYQPDDPSAVEMQLNKPLVTSLQNATLQIAKTFGSVAPINPLEILNWPGMLKSIEIDSEAMQPIVMALLDKALTQFTDTRVREGEVLAKLLSERLEKIKIHLTEARAHLPEIQQLQRAKLVERFNEVKLELDQARIEQEMILFTQRIDVAEELDRLESHVAEVQRVLKSGEAAGRRLDFLMQEFNREANTLGSKSVNLTTTRASVEMKVLIEQMREQVQNIE
ncbi:MAG: YicC/YloC family endoribonuclease [Gammaproteobacteria bacterium]|nr:YicC/YloC family endoribonuclease [Gammaproteobacteria bacterium]